VKVQLAGNMILGLEAASPRMMRMARNELNYGREVPIEEVRGMINDVTPALIQEWAGRCLARDKRRVTAIVPNGA
jgi:predicted Zn-dependent peptidase